MALLGVFADSMSYMNVDGMFGVVSLVCNRVHVYMFYRSLGVIWVSYNMLFPVYARELSG